MGAGLVVNNLGRSIFGGTRFTGQQAQFLRAGVRRGLTRVELRQQFRTVFSRGFPNGALTEIRQSIEAGDIAGAEFLRLPSGRRLSLSRIPSVNVVAPSGRFLVSARVRTRIRSTGQTLERFVRFHADEPPTREEFTSRVSEIIDRGVSQADSAMQVDGIEEVNIVEQRQA